MLYMKKLLLIAITCLLFTNSFALSMDVKALQNKLKTLGYYSGAISGVIDNEVRNALKQYFYDLKTCPAYVDQETCTLILQFNKKFNK